MLCVNLKPFVRNCSTTTGGISRVYIFDRADFDFTQAAADNDGAKPAYTAVALRDGAVAADGAKMFKVVFEPREAEYKYAVTKKGSSIKWDHSLEFLLPDLGQMITNWNEQVDKAAACCGIGLIVELNSGKVLVLGEQYVNGDLIPGDWLIAQDGSSGTSGKLRDDVNGHTAVLKGDYNRGAYEFSGGITAMEALANPVVTP